MTFYADSKNNNYGTVILKNQEPKQYNSQTNVSKYFDKFIDVKINVSKWVKCQTNYAITGYISDDCYVVIQFTPILGWSNTPTYPFFWHATSYVLTNKQ